jgi:hypothetical protein
MNRYAQIALDRHRQHRPLEHSLIDDPTRFFTEIGEEIQAEVTSHRDEILGPQRPGESIENYRQRSYQAVATAEELVLSDHYLFQRETPNDPIEDEGDEVVDRYMRELDAINRLIHNTR